MDVAGYYNRFDPTKNYESHVFLPDRGFQSSEANEIQSQAAHHLRGIADAIFRDADIIRDCSLLVDPFTGECQLEGGALYLRGMVRGIAPASFVIPIVGVVTIGVYLQERLITELDDAALRDPATNTRNYQEPGAYRLEIIPVWGFDGDDQAGEFYPVYTVVDGIAGAKEAPPSLDAVQSAIARYDRDSAGGTYIVRGLAVKMQPDHESGDQVYTIDEGRARVFGFGIEFKTGRRVRLAGQPELKRINNEPHLSASSGEQTIILDRGPAATLVSVSITQEKTVNLTHGVVTGAQDPLPDASVLEIIEVKQGVTTFTAGADYNLTAGRVDWTPAGAEPAPGSTYTVKYRHITLTTPTDFNGKSFKVTGAVSGTIVLATYDQMLPRIDRLCISTEGVPTWVRGVSSEWTPIPPRVPGDLLALATIYQTWDDGRRVISDAVKVVPMNELAEMDARIDYVLMAVAQSRLENSIHMRESSAKKGIFTDPFIDDSQRDAGTAQTAAIVRGELMLPISATVHEPSDDITVPTFLAHARPVRLEQPLRTGKMQINAYMAFVGTAGAMELTPFIDRWTETATEWTSATTTRFWANNLGLNNNTRTASEVISRTTRATEFLRPIDVEFTLSGFGAGENLSSMTFDGIPVTPTAI